MVNKVVHISNSADQKSFVGVNEIGRCVSWVDNRTSVAPTKHRHRHRHWEEIVVVIDIVVVVVIVISFDVTEAHAISSSGPVVVMLTINVEKETYQCPCRGLCVCRSVRLSVTIVSPAKNGCTDRDVVWDVNFGGPKEALLDGGAYWRYMANTTGRRRCGLMSNYFDHLLFFVRR